MQPNEGAWDDATAEESALIDTLPDGSILGPPLPEGEKVRLWLWTTEKRYSSSGPTRLEALKKMSRRFDDAQR